MKYPDGQQGVKIKPFSGTGSVEILSRFNSFMDLELIICAVKSLRGYGAKEIHLFIPYLLGARSDRKFPGQNYCYLSRVIAPILNSLKLDKITCTDVHNPAVADACIDNLVCLDNATFISEVIGNIPDSDFVIVTPDEGASKKIFDLCKQMGLMADVVTCSKDRDSATGEIIGVNVPCPDFKKRDILIIDDICDGGRTFTEIGKVVKLRNPGKMYLAVTHGIFSKRYKELFTYFDKVFCTNSVFDVWPEIEYDMTKLKQIKVI